jgi:hypothetical protein
MGHAVGIATILGLSSAVEIVGQLRQLGPAGTMLPFASGGPLMVEGLSVEEFCGIVVYLHREK